MKITPKFYSRKMPAMIDGEIKFVIPSEHPGTLRMFVRDDDSDKDYPPRICVEMTLSEVIRLIDHLQFNLKAL